MRVRWLFILQACTLLEHCEKHSRSPPVTEDASAFERRRVMKKTSMVVGSLMLASLGTAGAANAADGELDLAQSNSSGTHDCGAVALSGELGTERSPLTSTATSFIRTVVPIGANHNGTLLRASGAKSKRGRNGARRARSI
jgi:hypothetical protein